MWVFFPRSASGAWGDFLGANSRAPTSSHSPWECTYLPLAPCTWFSPGHDPLMGRIYSGGLLEVAWVLHESGYSLLILELWPWSHLSLLFVTVMGYTLTWRRFLLATPYSSDALSWRRLAQATPHLGDALSWRRPLLVTPCPGDASSWRRLVLATPSVVNLLTSLLWGPRVVPPYVDFDFGQHPGTGRYKYKGKNLFSWRAEIIWEGVGSHCHLDSNSKGEQPFYFNRRRTCLYLLHLEESQDQLDSYQQSAYEKIHEVKWLPLPLCCFNF